jgi:hypothetical protein
MATTNIQSKTCFDILPNEIIFIIFSYLSYNDIIYAFFFLNQRFNNLLLQNQRYLTYLELSTRDLNAWRNILSMIGYRIECLNINTNDLSFPLTYLPNLNSIVVSLPRCLHSFQSQEEKTSFDELHNNNNLFLRIFSYENLLETLTIPSYYTKNIDNLKINFNVRSMTLISIRFEKIFSLITYTSNLEYLNVETYMPEINQRQISIDKRNIKLKQLYLTLHDRSGASKSFDQLTNGIKQFSTSLTCLSLNLVNLFPINVNEIPVDSEKLQNFLESMIELKELHLYAKIDPCFNNFGQILSGFTNQYWLDHNWSFGIHKTYFYTLPFHYDCLHEFDNGFKYVQSSNPEILINNQIWHNVKIIELEKTYTYNRNFVEQLKIKMPKLNLIKFRKGKYTRPYYSLVTDCFIENIDSTLDNITTIEFIGVFFDDIYDWIVYLLPNLRHLKSGSTTFDVGLPRLRLILNERIPNVEYIKLCLSAFGTESEQWCADAVMKIFKKRKNLKSLLIYAEQKTISLYIDPLDEAKLNKLIEQLNMNAITKDYEVKHFRPYYLFLKRKLNDSEVQDAPTLYANNRSTLTDYTAI